MSYTVNPIESKQTFLLIYNNLSKLGQPGFERLAIIKTTDGYFTPQPIAKPGLLERIIRFIFRFKFPEVRLHEVTQFTINWLLVQMSLHIEEFTPQNGENELTKEMLSPLTCIEALAQKAKMKNEHDALVKYAQWPTNFAKPLNRLKLEMLNAIDQSQELAKAQEQELADLRRQLFVQSVVKHREEHQSGKSFEGANDEIFLPIVGHSEKEPEEVPCRDSSFEESTAENDH
jgi:hypothetical protein